MQPCDPCFCSVCPRAVQSRDRVRYRSFTKQAIRQTSGRALGRQIHRRPCSWRREQMECATRAACEKLESHRPRCRGSSKDKHQMRHASRQPKTKATANHAAVLALNPSPVVAACLVAPTRIARRESQNLHPTSCSPTVGCYRLPSSWSPFETKSGASHWKTCFARPAHQPDWPEWAQDHTKFSTPSVAVRGERAATSVRRLLNPARSLENDRSVCWVAFHARHCHKPFRSRNFVRFLVRRVSSL